MLVLVKAHLLVDFVQAARVGNYSRGHSVFLQILLQVLLQLLLVLFFFAEFNLLLDIATDLINFVGERFRRAAYEATYWVNAIVVKQGYEHRLPNIKPYFRREIRCRRPSLILLLSHFFKITNHVIDVLMTLLVVNAALLPGQFYQLLNDQRAIQLRTGILNIGIFIGNGTAFGNIEPRSQVIDVFTSSVVSL